MSTVKYAGVGAVCGLLGLGLGLVMGAPPDTAPAPREAAASAAPRPEACPDCPACPDKICPGEAEATDLPPVVLQPLWGIEDGDADPPTPWPEDLPDELNPDVVAAELEALAEECGFAPDLQHVDCSQPPCMAVVLTDEGVESPSVGPGASCPAWKERFGDWTSTSSDSVLCDDGSRRTLKVVGPAIPEEHKHLFDIPERDPDDPWKGMRRFTRRIDGIKSDLGCSRPGYVTVENHLDHSLKWIPDEGG